MMNNPGVVSAWESDSNKHHDKASAIIVKENNNDEETIYDSSLLHDLDLKSCDVTFNPPITVLNPGEGLRLRPLQLSDYEAGFLNLLGQLTKVGEICEEEWETRFRSMKNKNGTYFVTVLEDTHTKQVWCLRSKGHSKACINMKLNMCHSVNIILCDTYFFLLLL